MEWLSLTLHHSLKYDACSTAPHPTTHRSVWSCARASGTTSLPTPASGVGRGRGLVIFGAYALGFCAATSTALLSAVSRRRVLGGKAHTPPGRALFLAVCAPPLLPLHTYICVLAEALVEVLCCAVRADQQSSFLVLSSYSQRTCDVTLHKTLILPCEKRRNVSSV